MRVQTVSLVCLVILSLNLSIRCDKIEKKIEKYLSGHFEKDDIPSALKRLKKWKVNPLDSDLKKRVGELVELRCVYDLKSRCDYMCHHLIEVNHQRTHGSSFLAKTAFEKGYLVDWIVYKASRDHLIKCYSENKNFLKIHLDGLKTREAFENAKNLVIKFHDEYLMSPGKQDMSLIDLAISAAHDFNDDLVMIGFKMMMKMAEAKDDKYFLSLISKADPNGKANPRWVLKGGFGDNKDSPPEVEVDIQGLRRFIFTYITRRCRPYMRNTDIFFARIDRYLIVGDPIEEIVGPEGDARFKEKFAVYSICNSLTLHLDEDRIADCIEFKKMPWK